MWRTFAFFISLLVFLSCNLIQVHAQDTIPIPLKIKMGIEVSGPAIHYSDKNLLNEEGYISVDLDEKHSAVLAAGYLNYKYSQYNYSYLNHGSFVRIGMDFNLLKPDKSLGKYWAGIGLRYGLSRFISETPSFDKENYWGTTSSSIAQKTNWAHFIEATPGVRAEIFNHFSIGWSVSLRMLLYSGTGKDLKSIYFPGYGNGAKTITAGLSYYIVLNIPYKKINVILKKEVKEESDDSGDSGTSGKEQQSSTIRQ
jgi:hypothetical protein